MTNLALAAQSIFRIGTQLLILMMIASVFTACATGKYRRSRASHNGRAGLLSDGQTGFRSGSGKREIAATPEPSILRTHALGWPLKQVRVTSEFGSRGSGIHEGVDLKASIGTPVYAAQSGTVLYAGSKISGYGRLIVIRHPTGVATVYAHNSKLKVIARQKVKKGQLIALSGNTGHSSGPHLHFEVRRGTLAMDPMRFLAYGGGPPKASARALAAAKDPTEPPVVRADRGARRSRPVAAKKPVPVKKTTKKRDTIRTRQAQADRKLSPKERKKKQRELERRRSAHAQ